MNKRIIVVLIIIIQILVGTNVFAYDFKTPQVIRGSAEKILDQQKAQLKTIGPEALGYSSQEEVDSLRVADIIPMIELNLTSIYMGLDINYEIENQKFIHPNYDGVSKDSVQTLDELNLMDQGTSLWFVMLESDLNSNVIRNSSMVFSTNASNKASFEKMSGPAASIEIFKSTLNHIEVLAKQMGSSTTQIMLYRYGFNYYFGATVDGQEWVLPVPTQWELDFDHLEAWQPERLWTVDEFVQAHKNAILANRAEWLANDKVAKAGGSHLDLINIPVVENSSYNPWLLLWIVIAAIAMVTACVIIIWARKRSV